MPLSRDLQLLIAAVALIAGVSGALILPGFWLKAVVLVAGVLIACWVTGILQQLLIRFT